MKTAICPMFALNAGRNWTTVFMTPHTAPNPARKADGNRRRWCKPSRRTTPAGAHGPQTQNHKTEVRKMDLFFESFMGMLQLFTITEDGGIRTLNTYFDTPENRAALQSIYGAVEVTGWKMV